MTKQKIFGIFGIALCIVMFFASIFLFLSNSNYHAEDIQQKPDTLKVRFTPEPISHDTSQVSLVTLNNNIIRVDSLLCHMYTMDIESSQGGNQLHLLIEKWNQNKKNYYIYIGVLLCVIAILSLLVILAILGKIGNRRIWQYTSVIKQHPILFFFLLVLFVFIISFYNFSRPFNINTKDQVDPFFAIVCFLTIALSFFAFSRFIYAWFVFNHKDSYLIKKGSKKKMLVWAALSAWLLGFLCFFIGMYTLGTQKSFLAVLLRPAIAASKMFLMADSVGDISYVLRQNGYFMAFYALVKLFVLSVTSATIISVVWYRIRSYWDIRGTSTSKKTLYVFIGLNEASKLLAKKIKDIKDEKKVVLFVVNVDEKKDTFTQSPSVGSFFGTLTQREEAFECVHELDSQMLLSNTSISSKECLDLISSPQTTEIENLGDKAFEILGLKSLRRYIEETQKAYFFFLNEDERTNTQGAKNLREIINVSTLGSNDTEEKQLTFYCHARRSASSALLETPAIYKDMKKDKTEIKILDSSRLAVQVLLRDEKYQPVNYVEPDKMTASVASRYEALVIGFGETGQDITDFLYEFGAFLDKRCTNGEIPDTTFRSPFRLTAIDSNMRVLEEAFLHHAPAIKNAYNFKIVDGKAVQDKSDPMIVLKHADLDSESYYDILNEVLLSVNCVFLTLGDDRLNMRALKSIMEILVRKHNGLPNNRKFNIFIRNYDREFTDEVEELTRFYNGKFNTDVIVCFGKPVDLFTYDLIVNEKIEKNARVFYEAYARFKGETPNWTKRHDKGRFEVSENMIRPASWENWLKVWRQERQDMNNYIHIGTKLQLIGIGPGEKDNKMDEIRELYDSITFSDEGRKFEIKNNEILQTNLARNEHLRWNASHEMLGYMPPSSKEQYSCNELENTHNCLIPWEDLPEATAIHNRYDTDYPVDYQAYDYLVTKTSLGISINGKMPFPNVGDADNNEEKVRL
ncbi:MAG: hypothetical protein J6X07_11795 [Prevotella sp.]|nr:hypothetical protein [Prevotella sp.]